MFSDGLSQATLRPCPCDGGKSTLTLKAWGILDGYHCKAAGVVSSLQILPVPIRCHCSGHCSRVLLHVIWMTNMRLNCRPRSNLDICVLVEMNIDWHACLVPVHSEVQLISEFLVRIFITALEKRSFES